MTQFQTIQYETPAPHVARIVLNRPETRNAQDTRMFALKLTKEAVNAAEDAQGRAQAMQTSFALHQLAHTHWLALHGMLIDPTGLPPETARALGRRAQPPSASVTP